MRKILFEAHRGVSTDRPENTMSAFVAAWEQGYDMIELDPKFTKDNVCVILHDGKLNRTARYLDGGCIEGDLPIKEVDSSFLDKIEVGSWFDKIYMGEKLPTLTEVLNFSREKGIPLKLDNVIASFTPEQRQIMYTQIRDAGIADRIGLTTASVAYAAEIAKELPKAEIHYDGIVSEENLIALKNLCPTNSLYVWQRFDNARTSWCKVPPVNEESVQFIHSYGIKVGVWILSEPEELDKAIALGADILETTGSIKPIDE